MDSEAGVQGHMDHRWGLSLPEEVLVYIFQMVVNQDGAVPFLCRMARVCHLWNAAASAPSLWRRVSVGYCWIKPRKTQLRKTEMKIKDTLHWLAENRFSQLRDFSLCHWEKNVDYAVEVVSQSCRHLRSLTLSYCYGVTEKTFQSLGANSRSLEGINVQDSEFQAEGLVAFLETHGSQIRQILFSNGPGNDSLISAISRGCCPDLELLAINPYTKHEILYYPLPICIQDLQNACPKLKTFRIRNGTPMPTVMRNGPDSTTGFPLLEELLIGGTYGALMTDENLRDILFGSTKLRVLNLSGIYRVTPFGLAALPCVELECLFWERNSYTSTGTRMSPKHGLHMLTEKWSGTLRELDITNQQFSKEDLQMAMSYLAHADSLCSLHLSGTNITPPALRLVISQSTALSYLNLSSCYHLPEELQGVHRGQEDIRQLLDHLD